MKEVIIKEYRRNLDLPTQVSKARNIPESEARRLLRYNVITPAQLAIVTGLTESGIRTKMWRKLSRKGGETGLDTCYAFGEEIGKSDVVFVLRNEKCENFIEKCLMSLS